jgi:antirestriction protein ArdC
MAETDRRTEALHMLEAGIARLTDSEAWKEWLAVQSRFHRYSFYNTLLILTQRPEASRVAGFHTWRQVGRHVRKGEHGIWILAPMTRRIRDEDGREDAEPVRIISGFKPVTVFDVGQTDGEELPEVCTRLDGEDEAGVFARLVEVAGSIGYCVEDVEIPGESNGDCTFELRRIRVEVRNTPAQRVKTLAHEIAHAILHEGFSDRALAELEAESTAYVVCSALGVTSDQYSFGYVAGWAGGGDEAIARIKSSGDRIHQAADAILTKLEAA